MTPNVVHGTTRVRCSQLGCFAESLMMLSARTSPRIVPTTIGPYRLSVDGTKELRVAAPVAREIDLRPRAVLPAATSSSLGGGVSAVDVSWMIALALLGLVAAETVVRALTRPRGEVA